MGKGGRGMKLVEVSNGWFSRAMFCPKCENVYALKLIKISKSKVDEEFLAQAKKEAARKVKPSMF